MKKNALIQFIEEHPALNIQAIAKETSFSPTLLYGILSGEKALLGDKAFELAKVLSHYGLVLNGWTFKPYDYEEFPLMLQAYRFCDEFEVEDFEPQSGVIYYKLTIQKSLMDEWDFAEFLKIGY
jgi:hypothetical protein